MMDLKTLESRVDAPDIVKLGRQLIDDGDEPFKPKIETSTTATLPSSLQEAEDRAMTEAGFVQDADGRWHQPIGEDVINKDVIKEAASSIVTEPMEAVVNEQTAAMATEGNTAVNKEEEHAPDTLPLIGDLAPTVNVQEIQEQIAQPEARTHRAVGRVVTSTPSYLRLLRGARVSAVTSIDNQGDVVVLESPDITFTVRGQSAKALLSYL